MNVFILTEGGKNKGFGHIVRCSSIYHAFKIKDISPIFIINGDDSILPILDDVEFSIKNWLIDLPLIDTSDIVIIDSYLANEDFYREIFNKSGLLVSFDDDNRINYPGGIVINGNVLSETIDYPFNNNIVYFLGSNFASLRKEYWNINPINIRRTIKNILITFGGDDIRNLTPKILNLICNNFPNINKRVIVGKSFNNINEIEKMADGKTQFIYSPNSKEMLKEMLNSDIAISAGGQTTYEFARIGLPSIAISVADNQTNSILNWQKLGFLEYAGLWNDEYLFENICEKLNKLFDYEFRKKKQNCGIHIIDGLGAKRIVNGVLNG